MLGDRIEFQVSFLAVVGSRRYKLGLSAFQCLIQNAETRELAQEVNEFDFILVKSDYLIRF